MAKAKAITWTTEQLRLADLQPWAKNPRLATEQDVKGIEESLDEFGLVDPLVVNRDRVSLISGHRRREILLRQGPDAVADVRVPSRALDEHEAERLALRLNRNHGRWDWDKLANEFDVDALLSVGFTSEDFEIEPPDPDPPNGADQARESAVTCPKCGETFKPKKGEA